MIRQQLQKHWRERCQRESSLRERNILPGKRRIQNSFSQLLTLVMSSQWEAIVSMVNRHWSFWNHLLPAKVCVNTFLKFSFFLNSIKPRLCTLCMAVLWIFHSCEMYHHYHGMHLSYLSICFTQIKKYKAGMPQTNDYSI